MMMTNTKVNQVSTEAILALRASMQAPEPVLTVTRKPARNAIDVSLEKYQEAVDFYTDHPNQEMYKSYQTSLNICQSLKEAFELSSAISKETEMVKKKRMKGMEREETLSSLLMQRMKALELIQQAKSELEALKQQRLKLRHKRKPH